MNIPVMSDHLICPFCGRTQFSHEPDEISADMCFTPCEFCGKFFWYAVTVERKYTPYTTPDTPVKPFAPDDDQQPEPANEPDVPAMESASESPAATQPPMTDYEAYQLRWMLEHGHSLTELIRALQKHSEDAEQMPLEQLFREWAFDSGFGGEIWSCEKEWEDCEANRPSLLDLALQEHLAYRSEVLEKSPLETFYQEWLSKDLEGYDKMRQMVIEMVKGCVENG